MFARTARCPELEGIEYLDHGWGGDIVHVNDPAVILAMIVTQQWIDCVQKLAEFRG